MPSENKNDEKEYHPAPSWLTSAYLENILKKHKNCDGIKIFNLEITPASAKGDNYASIMTRIKVEYNSKNSDILNIDSYIVKTSFEGDSFAIDIFQQYGTFKCEMDMYDKVIPKLNSLLKDDIDAVEDIMFPEVIFVDYEHSAIILEDLSVKGYTTVNRLDRLDMDHIKIALKKLAKLHASSAVLNEKHDQDLETFDHGIFNRYTSAFQPFFCGFLAACSDTVLSLGKEYKCYSDKLKNLVPNLMTKAESVFDPQKHHFNCLNHGDFWTANIMFTYDENNRPTDAILIDFQFSCWTSPGIDLQYFFNTSLKEEIRMNQQEDVLMHYYGYLSNTLRTLKFKGKIPSHNEFWIQYQEKHFYAVTSAFIAQAVMINEVTDDADFHALMKNDERGTKFKRCVYKNPKVQQTLKNLLPIFDRRGLLESE